MKLVKNRKLKLIDEVEFDLYEDNDKYYVDGEKLHEWLGVKTPFTKWIQRRINQYKFDKRLSDKIVQKVENTSFQEFDFMTMSEIDFYSILGKTYKANDGRPKTKYFLLPDMVRQLAMVEDAEKGKLVRKYYIQLEKYVNETNQLELFREWRKTDSENRRLLHEEICDDRDCIKLSVTMNNITAYLCKLPKVYKKYELYKMYVNGDNKDAWVTYLEIQDKMTEFYHTFAAIGSNDIVCEVCKLAVDYYIGDLKTYKEYIKSI